MVDTLSAAVNGDQLTVTIGRGERSDLTATVTLPTGGGDTPPTRTEDTYVNTHATNVIGDYTETGANSADYAVTQTLTIPTFAGDNRYVSIAQPTNEPDITSINIGGVEQLGAFTKATGTTTVGGESYEVLVIATTR